jgi:hypothetical protein
MLDGINPAGRLPLPNRRHVIRETIHFVRPSGAEVTYECDIGFDILPNSPVLRDTGKKPRVYFDPTQPKEIFLTGGKTGTDLDFELQDFACCISVALQSGAHASEMAKSVAKMPEEIDGPPIRPVTITGAALLLLAKYERGEATQ